MSVTGLLIGDGNVPGVRIDRTVIGMSRAFRDRENRRGGAVRELQNLTRVVIGYPDVAGAVGTHAGRERKAGQLAHQNEAVTVEIRVDGDVRGSGVGNIEQAGALGRGQNARCAVSAAGSGESGAGDGRGRAGACSQHRSRSKQRKRGPTASHHRWTPLHWTFLRQEVAWRFEDTGKRVEYAIRVELRELESVNEDTRYFAVREYARACR